MRLANIDRHYLNAMLEANKNAVWERVSFFLLPQQSQQFVALLDTSIDWITGLISKWARAHLLTPLSPSLSLSPLLTKIAQAGILGTNVRRCGTQAIVSCRFP